jgi:hypothetical protein
MLSLPLAAQAQIAHSMSSPQSWTLSLPEVKDADVRRWSLPGFTPDRDIYAASRPMLRPSVNTTSMLGDSFWMGSVTTQSYNRGKVGRYYYWDVQGNLRGSLLFVDIAGKHKRGLKLVFPRHRVMRHP